MNEHICVAVNTKATGEKIRKLREKCGFSKTEVQESLGLVGVQSIYDWENGVKLPNIENALGLARLLGGRSRPASGCHAASLRKMLRKRSRSFQTGAGFQKQ